VTKEQKNTPEVIVAEEPVAAPKKKSGLIKYIIFGLLGIVAVGAVAVGTVFLLGGATHKVEEAAKTSDSTTASHDTSATHAELTPADSLERIADSLAGTMEDTSILADVKKNLTFLDGSTEAESTMKVDSVKAVQDSMVAMGWIAKEKERLRQKETDLSTREVKLGKLDSEVSRKMLKLEQVTTSKIADLAKLYDGIDPKAVAAMMASLDNETIVVVLPRMKQKNASQVLGLLPPARAAQISKQMISIAEN
jgi:flagellar motility protein MotE (MotC chaperone)